MKKNEIIHPHRDDWEDAFVCMQERAFRFQQGESSPEVPDTDIGVRETLKDFCSWDDSSAELGDLRAGYEAYDIDLEFGFPPKNVSLMSWPLGPRVDYQNKYTFVYDTGNLARILRKVAEVEELYIEDDVDNSRIVINTTVVEVSPVQISSTGSIKANCADWADDDANGVLVKLETRDANGVVTLKYVTAYKFLSTVSVGVLLSDPGIFSPRLGNLLNHPGPLDRIYEMNKFRYLEFQFADNAKGDQPFADDYQFFWIETPGRDQCSWWQSYSTKWDDSFEDSNVAVCTLTTPTVDELLIDGEMNETEANTLLHNSFGKVFDLGDYSDCTKIDSPETWTPTAANKPTTANTCTFRVFDTENANWKGGFENFKVGPGRTISEIEADFELVYGGRDVCSENRIVSLGGTAGCRRHYGYVQGGLYSGYKLADCAIRNLRGNNPLRMEQFCDDPANPNSAFPSSKVSA